MLRLLGTIYYILAALSVFFGLTQGSRYDGGATFWYGLVAAFSFCFFGAICLVADDIRSLLTRIADNRAPDESRGAPPAVATVEDRTCTFCNREVPKGRPCSTLATDTLRRRAPLIVNPTCRAELKSRGYLAEDADSGQPV